MTLVVHGNNPCVNELIMLLTKGQCRKKVVYVNG